MQINCIAFGQVAAITGNSFLLSEEIKNTDELLDLLHKNYPALAKIKYALAVNKKMIKENMELSGEVTVALLPPFSGG